MSRAVAIVSFVSVLCQLSFAANDSEVLARGEFLAHAASCVYCHTNKGESMFSGGVKITTPFGDMYTPNISSHKEKGIGSWSTNDFILAVRLGQRPNKYIGGVYSPAFPYTSYTYMSNEDVAAIFAYIMSQPESDQENLAHDIPWSLNNRLSISAWRMMNFLPFIITTGIYNDKKPATWNHGMYLAEAVFHCTECHTPRDKWTQGLDRLRTFQGSQDKVIKAPAITQQALEERYGFEWSEMEYQDFLAYGYLPDGDMTGGKMMDIVEHGTEKLSVEDQKALVEYLMNPSWD